MRRSPHAAVCPSRYLSVDRYAHRGLPHRCHVPAGSDRATGLPAVSGGYAVEARAIFFVAPRRVEVAPVDLPDVGSGEVLVSTCYSGISAGSELLAYRGEIDPNLPLDETIGALGWTFCYPFRYGYSCVGRVERGDGALAKGELVFAFHPHQDRFIVPADDVIPLGD